MEEGEQRLCLVEPTLELMEETPLKVQVQLLEEMQDMEALEAEEEVEALVEGVGLIHLPLLVLVINQEQMQVLVELVVMGAVAEQGALEGRLLIALQGQEVQEVLAVLEEEAEAAEMLGLLQVLMEEKVMVVMAEQEAMAEVEGVVAVAMTALSALAALVALD